MKCNGKYECSYNAAYAILAIKTNLLPSSLLLTSSSRSHFTYSFPPLGSRYCSNPSNDMLFVPMVKTRCANPIRIPRGIILESIHQSSLNTLFILTNLQNKREIIINTHKPKHQYVTRSVGRSRNVGRNAGAGA